MSESFNNLKWFQERRSQLATMLHAASDIIDELSMPEFAGNLKRLGKKLEHDSFKIQVVGTFKNGKSTFINALLGEDVLPARPLPCTAIINEVKYGDEKKAVLYFHPDMEGCDLSTVPAQTLAHIEAHKRKDVPPMEVPYDRISEYLTIPIFAEDDAAESKSPYYSMELFYPSPLLGENVEIIDSPGLNEHDERTAVTLEYLDKADAIIFLMSANQPCAAHEKAVIEETLLPKGFSEMLFVGNRMDTIPSDQREDMKRYLEMKTKQYSDRRKFFVSAYLGLQGKVTPDAKMLEESGMPEFESYLTDFLAQEKGRIKLSQPARELNEILSKEALYKAIPAQRKQLSMSLEALRARYADAKPKLADLEARKKQMHTDLTMAAEKTAQDIRRAVVIYYKDLMRQVTAWVQDYEPKTKFTWATKKDVQLLLKEISEMATAKIRHNYKEWNTYVLTPLVEEKCASFRKEGEIDLGRIQQEIDSVAGQITDTPVEVAEVKPWERVAGTAIAFAFPGSGVEAAMNGMQSSNFNAKKLGIDIAYNIGTFGLMTICAPLGVAVFATRIWQSFKDGNKGTVQRVKAEVIQSVTRSLNETYDKNADDIERKIREYLGNIIEAATGSVDHEINAMRSQVEESIRELERGKTFVAERTAKLDECEKKIQQLSEMLDAFVFELAGLNSQSKEEAAE
ncbi:MAG: dynamin family protein [Muribaculaceae bacterium]|nr:dynamin family protein [Muribaculaceae bacterium]